MSWGFFVDLSLALPTAEWTRLARTRTRDHALPPGFFGFKEKDLEWYFAHEDADDLKLSTLPKLFGESERGWQSEEVGATTHIRALALLDRSGPAAYAKVAAALLHAATATGSGHLVLVNDGTYSGEDGVVLRLDAGAITRSRVADCNLLVDPFGAAVFEGADAPSPEEVIALAAGGRKRAKKAAPKKK